MKNKGWFFNVTQSSEDGIKNNLYPFLRQYHETKY